MAKLIITLNGLRIVIILGMLIIILCGIRLAAEIIVPFILALFITVVLSPLMQYMARWRVPCVLVVSISMTIIVMAMVLLLAYLNSALNRLTRTLPQYRNSIMTSSQVIEPSLQRIGIDVLVGQLAHYIDPNAAMMLLTNLLTQLSNAMLSIFLLLLMMLFMLLEVLQLSGKSQQVMTRPVGGMVAIQHAVDSVSHYLMLRTATSIITGLVAWAMLAALDVYFAFAWGLLAFTLNYIPNTGSALMVIPPIAQVLAFNSPHEALLVLAGYLLVGLVFDNILEPCIIGCGLGLSTLVVSLSLTLWGWLLGPVGMLLSVSLTVIVKIVLEQTAGGQGIAILLGDLNKERRPPQKPSGLQSFQDCIHTDFGIIK